MSLVQIAYQNILTKFRDWSRVDGKEKIEILHHASSLMGNSFRNALNIIQKTPEILYIQDYELFYLVFISSERFLLFKSNSKVRLNDCSCKSSWLHKIGQKAPYMCLHQIIIQLVINLFSHKIKIDPMQCQGTVQLSQILHFIK